MVRDRERRAHRIVRYIRDLREERRETLVSLVDNFLVLGGEIFRRGAFAAWERSLNAKDVKATSVSLKRKRKGFLRFEQS